MIKNYMLSVLVQNNSGVLTRVSGLFARRGYNISSLSVGETQNASISRITIVVNGDEYILDQIKKQLSKLEEVVKVAELKYSSSVLRELVLLKVLADKSKRAEIIEICNVFHTRIVDLSPNSMTIELSGRPEKNSAFIDLIDEKDVIEIVRTGVSGIMRGAENIYD